MRRRAARRCAPPAGGSHDPTRERCGTVVLWVVSRFLLVGAAAPSHVDLGHGVEEWRPYVDGAGPLAVLDPTLCLRGTVAGGSGGGESVALLQALEVLVVGNGGELLLLLLRAPAAAVAETVPGVLGAAALASSLRAPPLHFTLPASPAGQRVLLRIDGPRLHVGDCLAWRYPLGEDGPRVLYSREGRQQVLWYASEVAWPSVAERLGEGTGSMQFMAGEPRAYAARAHIEWLEPPDAAHLAIRPWLSPTFAAFVWTQPARALGHAVVARGEVDTARGIAFIDTSTCGKAQRGLLRAARFYLARLGPWRRLRFQVYRPCGQRAAAEYELRGQTRELDGAGDLRLAAVDLVEELLWFHGPLDCLGWHHEDDGIFGFGAEDIEPTGPIVRWQRGPAGSVGTVVRFVDGAALRTYSLAVDIGGDIDSGVDDSLPEECRHSPGERCCSDDRRGHVLCAEASLLEAEDHMIELSALCAMFTADYGAPLRPLLGPYDRCRVALPVPPLRAAHRAGPQPRRVFAFTFATNFELARPLIASATEYHVPLNIRGLLAQCSTHASDPDNCLMHRYRSVDVFVAGLHPLDLILHVDAYDVVFLVGLGPIVADFLLGEHELVFNAERICAPETDLAPHFQELGSPFCFLNGGVFFGYAFAVERMHRSISHRFGDVRHCGHVRAAMPSEEIFSCQRCYQLYFIEHRQAHRVALDTWQRLAACLVGTGDADFRWLSDGTLWSVVTSTRPSLLHANGEGRTTVDEVLVPLLASRPLLDRASKQQAGHIETGMVLFRLAEGRRRARTPGEGGP